MFKIKKTKVGYILAFFLGALGIHAFYYGKYIRGAIYAGISVFINPLIPIMVILGWIDMFFIRKWQRDFDNEFLPLSDVNKERPLDGIGISENVEQSVKKEMKNNNSIKTNKAFRNKNHSFYNENQIILEKYAHLTTPKYILEDVEKALSDTEKVHRDGMLEYRISVGTSSTNFIRDSRKYKNRKQSKVQEVPLKAYWTTFDSLNDRQLKWYLHWREQVLNEKYIDVDMSYIILFVYELINYSFNEKAAFNVSMMERLYENYKERHPKLVNYLPSWTADMLYEVGEAELAHHWDPEKGMTPELYSILEEEIPLDKVSITTWRKHFANHRETAYFRENRNKIYPIFKTGMRFLEDKYKNDNVGLIVNWFNQHDDRVIRELYKSAVISREIEAIHVSITTIRPTIELNNEITAMMKLSENISRKMNGINRGVKVEEGALTVGIKERLESHYLGEQTQEKTPAKKVANTTINSRFKVVKDDRQKELKGSQIPNLSDAPKEESAVQELVFDDAVINSKSKELNDLASLFETEAEKVEGKSNEKQQGMLLRMETMERKSKEAPSITLNVPNVLDTENGELDEDINRFVKELSDIEISFITLFKESVERTIAEEDAQEFVKKHGMMLGGFLSAVNSKAIESLGDIIFESVGNAIELELDEGIELLFTYIEERNVSEN